MKVRVESVTIRSEYFDRELTRVLVDGKPLLEGSYGTPECPEDNTRCRDYRWVEPALVKLAKALGAETELVECNEADPDEEADE